MELPRPLPEAAPTRAVGGWTLPDRWLPHMLLWPSLGALLLVFGYPLGYSFWLSLNAYNITRPAVFVGLNNYLLLVQDERLWQSCAGSFELAAISLLVLVVIVLRLALLLDRVELFLRLISTVIIPP